MGYDIKLDIITDMFLRWDVNGTDLPLYLSVLNLLLWLSQYHLTHCILHELFRCFEFQVRKSNVRRKAISFWLLKKLRLNPRRAVSCVCPVRLKTYEVSVALYFIYLKAAVRRRCAASCCRRYLLPVIGECSVQKSRVKRGACFDICWCDTLSRVVIIAQSDYLLEQIGTGQ